MKFVTISNVDDNKFRVFNNLDILWALFFKKEHVDF